MTTIDEGLKKINVANAAGDLRGAYTAMRGVVAAFDESLASELGAWVDATPMSTVTAEDLRAYDAYVLNGALDDAAVASCLRMSIAAHGIDGLKARIEKHGSWQGYTRHRIT